MHLGLRAGGQLLAQPANLAAAGALIALVANASRIRKVASRLAASMQQLLAGKLLDALEFCFGYRYRDAIGGDQIRLLQLPPALSSSSSSNGTLRQPRLSLHTFPLDQCPPYLALSYRYGPPDGVASSYDPSDRLLVVVDDCSFSVQPNLFHALTQLCHARAGQYIWVDSICINQLSATERAAQVSVMDRIYAGALETIIWLGPAAPSTPRALGVVRQIAVGAEAKILEWTARREPGRDSAADGDSYPEPLVKNGLPPLHAGDWLDLADIYARSWFGRVWMIQEVALSRDPTVLIGRHEVPWDAIGYAAIIVALSNALVGLSTAAPGMQNMPLVTGLVHAMHVQTIREAARGSNSRVHAIASSMDFNLGGLAQDPGSAVLRLLLSSSAFRATCRRDRVFALLGVANHLAQMHGRPRLDLSVDYDSSSDDHVLKELLPYLFQQSHQSLHLLSHAGLASHGAGSSMPSWMPSFENVHHKPLIGLGYSNLAPFCASGPRASLENPGPQFAIDKTALALHGLATTPDLGTIEELGETFSEMLNGRFTDCIKMLLHCGPTYSFTGQPIVEAFWRTLIMDCDSAQRPAPGHLAQSFSAWMMLITIGALCTNIQSAYFLHDLFDTLEPLWVLSGSHDATNTLPKRDEILPLLYILGLRHDPSIPKMSPAEQQAQFRAWSTASTSFEALLRLTLLPQRRMARTVAGHLCLVPCDAQVGDKVMILATCPTPLVLRRKMATEDCFEVVGDAFVHGVMFGEHIKEDTLWRNIRLI